MATSIYFNGRVTQIPGSYSEVDASGLSKVGLGATGIVACIGEAEGGKPTTPTRISNPGKVSKTYRKGDLLEAGLMLFDPSKDAAIQAGAQEVYFYKVNPSTQSTTTLDDASGADSILVTSDDYGLFTEKVNIDISTGTTGGKAVTVEFDGNTESFDNVGEDAPIILKYLDADKVATASFTRAGGLSATITDTLTFTDTYVGSCQSAGLLLNQPASGGVVAFVGTAGDTSTCTIYGRNVGVAVVETITLNGAATVNTSGTFSSINGVTVNGATGGLTFTGNGGTANAIVAGSNGTSGFMALTSALEVTQTTGAAVAFSSSNGSDATYLHVVGTRVGGASATEMVLFVSGAVTTTVTDWITITGIALGEQPTSATYTATSDFWQAGDNVKIVSTNASDAGTAIIYGTNTSNAAQSETIILNGTSEVTSTGSWNSVCGVKATVHAGTISVTSSSAPVITAFTLLTSDLSKGVVFWTTPIQMEPGTANAKVLSWTSTFAGQKAVVSGLNGAGTAAVELIDLNTAGATVGTWSQIDGIVTGHAAGTLNISVNSLTLTSPSHTYLKDWTTLFNTLAEWGYTVNEGSPATYKVIYLDEWTSAAISSSGKSLYAVQQAIIDEVTAGSTYVTITKVVGSTAGPGNTATAFFLTGGSEGATSFSHWQAALDALKDYRINTIVILTSDEAVHAAVVTHCTYMGGAGRSERDAVLGSATATTLAQGKSRAFALNTRHARLCVQDIKRFNTSGIKEQFPPYFTACIAAGMQAGSSVGTSLTFKYANIIEAVGNDATYTVVNDANELIENGVCVLEKVPNIGYRWLRNNTTHLADNNLAYCEASVNEAVNFAVYELRKSLETIVGKKGFSGTVNAALGVCVGILGELVAVGAITSYKNLTIELADDVMTVDVEIAPIVPVNFIKTTLHLVSASFSAA